MCPQVDHYRRYSLNGREDFKNHQNSPDGNGVPFPCLESEPKARVHLGIWILFSECQSANDFMQGNHMIRLEFSSKNSGGNKQIEKRKQGDQF